MFARRQQQLFPTAAVAGSVGSPVGSIGTDLSGSRDGGGTPLSSFRASSSSVQSTTQELPRPQSRPLTATSITTQPRSPRISTTTNSRHQELSRLLASAAAAASAAASGDQASGAISGGGIDVRGSRHGAPSWDVRGSGRGTESESSTEELEAEQGGDWNHDKSRYNNPYQEHQYAQQESEQQEERTPTDFTNMQATAAGLPSVVASKENVSLPAYHFIQTAAQHRQNQQQRPIISRPNSDGAGSLSPDASSKESTADNFEGRETMDLLEELSGILCTGLTRRSLELCIQLCELGVQPNVVAKAVGMVRQQTKVLNELDQVNARLQQAVATGEGEDGERGGAGKCGGITSGINEAAGANMTGGSGREIASVGLQKDRLATSKSIGGLTGRTAAAGDFLCRTRDKPATNTTSGSSNRGTGGTDGSVSSHSSVCQTTNLETKRRLVDLAAAGGINASPPSWSLKTSSGTTPPPRRAVPPHRSRPEASAKELPSYGSRGVVLSDPFALSATSLIVSNKRLQGGQ
eukprot:GHVS01090460.1.p1 GENE.GHVS01090460.1~~GHVS01090460.1.p1  ORF type:complete len:529 (-),score=118.80 GHVS01090460.1:231-1793(-)